MKVVETCPLRYGYEGRCNTYNNRQINLNPSGAVSSLPPLSSLSNDLFGNSSNQPRGKSRLTALAIAYSRFFLSDVLEVLESNMTSSTFNGCTNQMSYGKIKTPAVNYQTPVMDLSPIFGVSDLSNQALRSPKFPDQLKFVYAPANSQQGGLEHVMLGKGSVFVTGSANSNVDHFSIYIHNRFYHLHTKFVDLLNKDCPTCMQTDLVFESARIFVVMVAETIARDLAQELGKLPTPNFNFDKGIPSEFLLMSFMDRFPAMLPLYGDTNRTEYSGGLAASPLCALSNVAYETTLYNATILFNASSDEVTATPAATLAWLGYSSMFTLANKGGSLATNLRCMKSGVGSYSGNSLYDPIAAIIQRGRDNSFPSCQDYRASKGLPSVTFSDFGNDLFAKQFAFQYNNNFAAVELSVCMLLDSDLRDRMMGSLILGVLDLQNSTKLCNADGTTNFVNTPVAKLASFSGTEAISGTQLALVLQALCKSSPKIDLRALAMVEQLNFSGGNTALNMGPDETVDRFLVCTTANPFLAPNGKFIPQRAVLKEGNNPAICDWSARDPFSATPPQPGLFLSNSGKCKFGSDGQTRRCFCFSRDDCSSRGTPILNEKGIVQSCGCDPGFNRDRQNNVLCEQPSYPQTDLGDHFAINRPSSGNSPSPSCSLYNEPQTPIIPAGTGLINFTSSLPRYCQNSVCTILENHYLTGGCNNWAKPNLGRIYSVLGRIAPANYGNGISYVPESPAKNWDSIAVKAFPANSSPLAQNGLFRGMGKLLLDDAFKPSYVPMNEWGMRTGSDPSNPVQFKNLLTGWLDMSLVFPIPPSYGESVFNAISDTGGADVYPINLTDGSEMGMRTLFSRRYAQMFSSFLSTAPCTTQGRCSRGALSRCVREIALLEYRSIAREFLAEAKTMFPANQQPSFNLNNESLFPVELSAAKIFDLHFASPEVADCLSLNNNTVFDAPDKCLSKLLSTGLSTQRNLTTDLPAGTINNYVNQTKILGLGSLNAYLSKLNQNIQPYNNLSDNVLFNLHGSAAEYAVNFGILESILNRDERNSKETVYATCRANNKFEDGNDYTTFDRVLAFWIEPSSTRTLCGLFADMSYPKAQNLVLNVGYRPNMFRTASISSTC